VINAPQLAPAASQPGPKPLANPAAKQPGPKPLADSTTARSVKRSERMPSSVPMLMRSGPPKKVNGRISDDTKCPVHPKSNYTWGQCVFHPNHRSDDNGDKKPATKPKKFNGSRKGKRKGKDDADANCMHVNEPLDWDDSSDGDRSVMNNETDDQEIESVDGHMALAEAEQGMEDLSLDNPVAKKRKSVPNNAGKFIAF
jgi:hypothetical protein